MNDGPISSWERLYHLLEHEKLPWNAGKPDPELVKLVETGFVKPCAALEVGAGLGHDAAFLASKGFQVTAVDIAPSAVKLAQDRAAEAGVEDKIEFETADILLRPLEPGKFSFVNDRGFFHYLRGEDRGTYVKLLSSLLAEGGFALLRVYSEKEPPTLGPLRYSESELRRLWEGSFAFEGLKDSVFEGAVKGKSLVALMKKRASPS